MRDGVVFKRFAAEFQEGLLTTKKQDEGKRHEHWCDCDCVLCDTGEHEKCKRPECHMPHWKDLRRGPQDE